MNLRFGVLFLSVAFIFSGHKSKADPAPPVIASKPFTENYILGEVMAQMIERELGLKVVRRSGMGGTGILFEALKARAIDVYPEYSGTISESLLKNPQLKSLTEIRRALAEQGLVISNSLGFNNTYAIAVRRDFATKMGLKKISDLVKIGSSLRMGFSHEFVSREDGYPLLKKRYGFELGLPQSMEHSLSYEALAAGSIDVIDAYSTDAKIEKLDLVTLVDDLGIFPRYEAVLLARRDFILEQPEVWAELRKLEGKFDEKQMIALNGELDIQKRQLPDIASRFLNGQKGLVVQDLDSRTSISSRIWNRTQEHLILVGAALAFSILVGIPMGLLAIYQRHLGQAILLLSGLVQTIPSLALLCFLIPLFGIGLKPSLVALCLYGLLPIVVGTFVGIRSIDPHLIETARALGLSTRKRIWQIEIPLASRNIIAGIRTSAVVGIGMATLAALIGGGGYGAPILMGLATNNMDTILMGAVPASVMAIIVHILFLGLEGMLIPKGLKA